MKKIILMILLLGGIAYGSEGMNLEKCPDSPNCVITDKSDKKHYIEPISFKSANLMLVNKKLVDILKELGGDVVENNGEYIKVVFSTKVFKFKDIAEFKISLKDQKIYLRSAAQSGWYDFGVNRKRIEKIRELMREGK
nr:DUF1499 domain-containing protein [uncultured Cetobacterium sp.]